MKNLSVYETNLNPKQEQDKKRLMTQKTKMASRLTKIMELMKESMDFEKVSNKLVLREIKKKYCFGIEGS